LLLDRFITNEPILCLKDLSEKFIRCLSGFDAFEEVNQQNEGIVDFSEISRIWWVVEIRMEMDGLFLRQLECDRELAIPKATVMGRVLAHVVDGAGEEAAGAAGGVDEDFAGLRIDPVGHELGDGPRRVEFPGVAGGLEVAEDFLVDVAEVLALFQAVEVDFLQLVDDLAELLAAAHEVVAAIEDLADNAGATILLGDLQVLQPGKERVVDEVQQGVAGNALGIGGPVAPFQVFRNGRFVMGIGELPLGFLGIIDFQEKHPGELLDALVVAAAAFVFAHFILDEFQLASR
jgi:hypothetical protein